MSINNTKLLDFYLEKPFIEYLVDKCDFQSRVETLEQTEECLRFLYLTHLSSGDIPVNKKIDDIWHLLILETRAYYELCEKLPTQTYLHHRSTVYATHANAKAKEEPEKNAVRNIEWLLSYVANFGQFTSSSMLYWPAVSIVMEQLNLDLDALNCKLEALVKKASTNLDLTTQTQKNAEPEPLYQKENNWQKYIDSTIGYNVNYVLQDAYYKYLSCRQPGVAVDFGSGAGNESLFLVGKGWTVYAYDSNQRSGEILEARAKDFPGKLIFQSNDFESVILPSHIDLFVSFAALPFGKKSYLPTLIQKISKSMSEDGICAVQFFGHTTSYVINGACYGINELEIREIFEQNNFQIKYLMNRCVSKFEESNGKVLFDTFDLIAKFY